MISMVKAIFFLSQKKIKNLVEEGEGSLESFEQHMLLPKKTQICDQWAICFGHLQSLFWTFGRIESAPRALGPLQIFQELLANGTSESNLQSLCKLSSSSISAASLWSINHRQSL
jgi:hypothetical protein